MRAAEPGISQPARLELTLLDPQVARGLGIVAVYVFDKTLRVLAADERLDGVAKRVIEARAGVDDHVHAHESMHVVTYGEIPWEHRWEHEASIHGIPDTPGPHNDASSAQPWLRQWARLDSNRRSSDFKMTTLWLPARCWRITTHPFWE